MTEVKYLRKIQSFVKRSGRLSKAQSTGLNELWGDYGVNINESYSMRHILWITLQFLHNRFNLRI